MDELTWGKPQNDKRAKTNKAEKVEQPGIMKQEGGQCSYSS